MSMNTILIQKNLTKYQLSKLSGIPFATISDICTGKTRIEKCSAGTLYHLSKVLNIPMESLVEDAIEYRSDFETFKSNICHMVHDMGDIDFIIGTLEADKIRKLFQRQWYPESLYLLAMVDYLSRENGLPLCKEYNDIRKVRLEETLYPASVLTMCAALNNDQIKSESLSEAIPEFKRFNIIESEVRNVY